MTMREGYYDDGSGKEPRYYQRNAINAAVEAIAKGQDRVLLVMATGTGKTYTAFQIIWRLWKSNWHAGRQKRVLFLADRNILVDQTMVNDFRPFGAKMAKLKEQLDNFIDPESDYPVLVTTSRLLSTGVDAQTCRLIVLDRAVGSMTEFKQNCAHHRPVRLSWAKLLKRVFEIDMEHRPNCGGERAEDLCGDPGAAGDREDRKRLGMPS